YYEEAADSKLAESFNFDNASIRRGFIRKVYAILSVQLGITLSVICWFLFDRTTQEFVQANPLLLIIWTVIVFVSLIFLACCGDLRRKAPLNYILLILFTVAESFTVGTLTSFFEVNAVAMAVGITAVVCLGLTLFAFQTKWDFTLLGGVLFVTLLILMVSGIFAACFRTEGANIAYAALGAALFSIYLIYDTQLMMGGQHKYSISPEEYIFAAINLYVDVINLFLYILLLFARRR
ncbi:Protein lifeguard 1, partial [Gonioctena quinquepunctata]